MFSWTAQIEVPTTSMALTCGQPWLVNALAYEACFDAATGRDRSRPIRVDAIDRAGEALILRRVTHLDQLADKLDEERVRRVILPMLGGFGTWNYSFRAWSTCGPLA